jgi:protein O-mannosyl-transferase
MNQKHKREQSKQDVSGRYVFVWEFALPALLLLLAGVTAYWNSFSGEFVFDDINEIRDNPAMKTLWPPNIPMFTARAIPTRPIPYYSFAINYAIHETEVFGYHAVNLAIHLTNAILIYLIVRSTLALPTTSESLRLNATTIAFTSALLWVVHPLNTEAVTYIYQRIESMMAMFFLLTFYLFIRSEQSSRPVVWLSGSVVTAAIGMACKEVMVVIPAVIGLYDYAFFRKNLRDLLSVHLKYYTALVGTWGILFALMWLQSDKYGNATHTAWQHAITQPTVILKYLQLSIVPLRQNLDAGWSPFSDFSTALPAFAIVLVAFAMSAVFYPRYPRSMFLACYFFVVLSPTSSFVPVADLADEYRMYIPLAALTTGFSIGLTSLTFAMQKFVNGGKSNKIFWVPYGLLVCLACIALAGKTLNRNELYKDKFALWQDTIEQSPDNFRAHAILSVVCLEKSMPELALHHSQIALRLQPEHTLSLFNAGYALLQMDRPDEAMAKFRRVVEIDPEVFEVWLKLAQLALRQHDDHAALGYFIQCESTAQLSSGEYLECLIGQAALHTRLKRLDEARSVLQKIDDLADSGQLIIPLPSSSELSLEAVKFCYTTAAQPPSEDAAADIERGVERLLEAATESDITFVGQTFEDCGSTDAAIVAYRVRLERNPQHAETLSSIGRCCLESGRFEDAAGFLKKARRAGDNSLDTQINLGVALMNLGLTSEGLEVFERAVEVHPSCFRLWSNLGLAYIVNGRPLDANRAWKKALTIEPDDISTLRDLAWLMSTNEVLSSEAQNLQSAVLCAQRAWGLSEHTRPDCLDALAAAFASAGKFREAERIMQSAINLSKELGIPANQIEALEHRLSLYKSDRAYRE